MEKITKINVEGHEYSFAAGSVVEGSCASTGADWTKTVLLDGETGIVDGVFLSVEFTYGNLVGYDKPKTVYSSDGINFYYDQGMTEAVTLPPVRNYTATLVSGTEYLLEEYPVISINNVAYPVCNARGKLCGGTSLWADGDTVVILFAAEKFLVMSVTSSGDDIKVYPTMADLEEDLPNLNEGDIVATEDYKPFNVVDEIAPGVMDAVTSNAVYNAMNTWVDISSQVSLSIRNNNANVTIGYKKVYICGSLLKFDIYCDCNTSGLSEGSDLCQIVVTSSLFTLPYSLARAYNPSYYGHGVTTIGMNVYNDDNGIITARLTKGGITIGDFSFCATIPCLLS